MELRAIIIDDEQKGINALKLLIRMFIENIKIVAQSTSGAKGIELIENYKPEIVFLDINMPEMNGFDLLEKLKWKDFNLIFTTAHQEYALKALKNNAVDYLLKPIDYEDLRLAVNRIIAKVSLENHSMKFNYVELLQTIRQSNKQKILINSKTGVESIYVTEIEYLESQSNYTIIYLIDSREILATKTLKELEIQLRTEDSAFMRIHHSFIVNLNKVLRYIKTSESVVMKSGRKIPVAQRRRSLFFKWLDIGER